MSSYIDPDYYETLLREALTDRMTALDHNSELRARMHSLFDRLCRFTNPAAVKWSDLIEMVVDLLWAFTRLYVHWLYQHDKTAGYGRYFDVDKHGDLILWCSNGNAIILRNTAADDEFAEVLDKDSGLLVMGDFNAETGSFQ